MNLDQVLDGHRKAREQALRGRFAGHELQRPVAGAVEAQGGQCIDPVIDQGDPRFQSIEKIERAHLATAQESENVGCRFADEIRHLRLVAKPRVKGAVGPW